MQRNKRRSAAVEDYLKAIHKLGGDGGIVSTRALSEQLGVAPASVTEMCKHMNSQGLVVHTPYRGVKLGSSGYRIALQMVRRHRLLEAFLVHHLGYSWDEVHIEAERLEHCLSDLLEQRIASVLGDPVRDPHGDVIPSNRGRMSRDTSWPLDAASPGQQLVVRRVLDSDRAKLRYLGDSGILPGAELTVDQVMPFDGPLLIRLGGRKPSFPLGRALARSVFVEILP